MSRVAAVTGAAGGLGRAIGAMPHGRAMQPSVARAIMPRTLMISLTNPNNPAGRLIPEADLRALAAFADRHGIWLVVDEVYAGLEWAGPRPPSIAGLTPFGISTGSVSKALGLRTGWMICRSPEVIRDATILRENASEIMNVLGEHISEMALRPERLAKALGRARAEGGPTRWTGWRLSWRRNRARAGTGRKPG